MGAGIGGRVPTWRMVPGSSSESLALDVALQCQVPPEIVYRAAQLFKVQPVPPPPPASGRPFLPPTSIIKSYGSSCVVSLIHMSICW